MIEYIYFVKCPNCEDEHFDFFDEAKAFALGCLSQKPIITQIEVNRNDFGECTDSTDLGTIWSWEDECKECGPDAEKAGSHILTKADLENIPGHDPEFDELDNSVGIDEPDTETTSSADETSEISAIDEVPDNFRKPLVESRWGVYFKTDTEWQEFNKYCKMLGLHTMGDIEYFMQHEGANPRTLLDTLRDYCADLPDDFEPINECNRKSVPEGMTIEQLVEEMEENEDMVECTWCNDLFPKSECRKEVDLGYLCSRCEAAIKSRGEKLTFVENDYWDFLDEEVKELEEKIDIDTTGLVRSGNMEIWGIEPVADCKYNAILLKSYEDISYSSDIEQEVFDEMYNVDGLFTFGFTKGGVPELRAWNTDIFRTLSGCEIIFENPAYDAALEKVFSKTESLEGTDNAVVDCKVADVITHSEDEKPVDCEGKKKPLEKPLTESAMMDCPECGAEKAFDRESGVCNNCGFVL